MIAVLKPVIAKEAEWLALTGEKRIRAVSDNDGKGAELLLVVLGEEEDGERAAQRQKGSGAVTHQSPC